MGRLKNFVAKENTTCNLETVENLFRERRSVLTREFLRRSAQGICRTRQELTEKYTETDRIVDLKIDQLLITIDGESLSGSECNWYGSSEDKSNWIYLFEMKRKSGFISQSKHRI